MNVVEVMRNRLLCNRCWQPCLSVYERRVRRLWVWKLKESEVEMRKMTRRADRAEINEGDFSCRPDPSLKTAGMAPAIGVEVVLRWCVGACCGLASAMRVSPARRADMLIV